MFDVIASKPAADIPQVKGKVGWSQTQVRGSGLKVV
jgi:hypothetical protein